MQRGRYDLSDWWRGLDPSERQQWLELDARRAKLRAQAHKAERQQNRIRQRGRQRWYASAAASVGGAGAAATD